MSKAAEASEAGGTAKLEAGVGGGQSGIGDPSVGHSLAFIT